MKYRSKYRDWGKISQNLCWYLFFLISLEFLLTFHLVTPQVGHTTAYEYFSLYKMQSLKLACIFSHSTLNEPNIFFASYKVEDILFFSRSNFCRNFNNYEKFQSSHPPFTLKLYNFIRVNN